MAATLRQDKKDKTIRNILDAALLIFAARGFNSARMDDIAEKAGVNKAMIYYRIGNKLALYQAVVKDAYSDKAQQLSREIETQSTPQEKLSVYMATVADIMEAHPHFTRIMVREMVSGWTHFDQMVFEEVGVTFKMLQSVINDGIQKGVFAPTDPLAVHTMIIGTLILHHLALPVESELQAALDRPPSDTSGFAHLFPKVRQLILAALRPQTTEPFSKA